MMFKSFVFSLSTLSLGACVSSSQPAAEPAPAPTSTEAAPATQNGEATEAAPAATNGWLQGIDLAGSDYRDFAAAEAGECDSACNTEEQCLSWTWVPATEEGDPAHCWLKDAVPEQSMSETCISGIKTQASAASDAQ